jgi:hypothetical protein
MFGLSPCRIFCNRYNIVQARVVNGLILLEIYRRVKEWRKFRFASKEILAVLKNINFIDCILLRIKYLFYVMTVDTTNKASISSEDNRCRYISYLFNVSLNCDH